MNKETASTREILEQSILTALGTYSNVHRGSGQFSMVTTRLYEKAREIVLDYLGLDKKKFTVVFCSPRNADKLTSFLKEGTFRVLSDRETGLSLGIRAVAVQKKSLPASIPFMTGGGTARLIDPGWIVHAKAPARFEPGTPAIINVIAFARALQLKGENNNTVPVEQTLGEVSAATITFGHTGTDLSGPAALEWLKKQVIGREVMVPVPEGSKRFINFDYAASTPALLPAWETFRTACRLTGPQRAEKAGEVRAVISRFLNAPLSEYDVIFCLNTTEALNIVAESFSGVYSGKNRPVVVNTLLEHNSNDLPWRDIPEVTIERIKVDKEGLIDFGIMESVLARYNGEQPDSGNRVMLVAANGGSNVLGTFNDLQRAALLAHRYGVPLLVDAAQLIAHRKVDMKTCGIDCLVFSGHKMYAPFGTGVLVVKKGMLKYDEQEMELIRSSGEDNPGGIAAIGSILALLEQAGMDQLQKEEQEMTMHLLRGATQVPGITVYGITDTESPSFVQKGGVLAFNMKGMMPHRIADELALSGIGIRTGCHCAHLLVKYLNNTPPWAEKIQWLIVSLFPKVELPGVARVSLGIGNNREDIDDLIRLLTKIAQGNKNQHQSKGSVSLPPKKLFKKQMEVFVRKIESEVFSSSLRK